MRSAIIFWKKERLVEAKDLRVWLRAYIWVAVGLIVGFGLERIAYAQVPSPTPPAAIPAGPSQYIWPVIQPPFNDRVKRIALASQGSRVLRGDVPPDEEFDNWYKKYEFLRLAQQESLDDLPAIRQELFKRHIGNTKVQEVHDRLIALTLQYMTLMATRNFHPAVRTNAMLVIGELNAKEAVTVGNATAADPLPEALRVMLDELIRPEQLDAVRAAALAGIQRHVELEKFRTQPMPVEQRKLLMERLLLVAGATAPSPGRTEDGQLWLRRQAVSILAMVSTWPAEGDFQPGPTIAAALEKIVLDVHEPLPLRCSASLAMGQMRPTGDVQLLAARMGTVVGDALGEELRRLEYGQAVLDGAQKRLRYRIYCVQQGLGGSDIQHGVVAAASAQQKAFISQLTNQLTTIAAAIETAPDSASLNGQINNHMRQLDGLIRTVAPSTAAPAGPGPGLPPGPPPAGPLGPGVPPPSAAPPSAAPPASGAAPPAAPPPAAPAGVSP